MKVMKISTFDTAITVINRIVLITDDVRDLAIIQREFERTHGVTKPTDGMFGYLH